MLGTAMGIAAWGLITGVAMGKSGLPLPLMAFMSLVVFAGSARAWQCCRSWPVARPCGWFGPRRFA